MWLALCLLLSGLIHMFLWPGTRKPQPAQCPTIIVSCPDTVVADKPLIFTAHITGLDPKLKPVYRWTVWGGTIVEGQDTSSLKIKYSGLCGHAVTARVEVEGLDPNCSKRASCTMTSHCLHLSRLFDRYHNLRFKDEKARLGNLAIQLRNEPGAQGYIIVYAGRGDNAGVATLRADRAKIYLVNDEGIDAARIVTIDGGTRKERMVELYVVPMGAIPPQPEPDTSDDQ
jgi:hypothetical protein